MGYGDDIMASGMVRSIRSRGKRAAFGDGKRVIWGPWSEEVFRHNPYVAKPGEEGAKDIEWVDYYKGHRNYNSYDGKLNRWIWNYKFRPERGELFFDHDENKFSDGIGKDFILIEPNVPWLKPVAVNKDWGRWRYQAVADHFRGFDVVQFSHGRDRLKGVRMIHTPTFRHALAAMRRAKVAVLPEGGLHHGAAAVGLPAVVLFGGFIPPQVTGYSDHVNLTGGADVACGSWTKCNHCRAALDNIPVEEVCNHVADRLN